MPVTEIATTAKLNNSYTLVTKNIQLEGYNDTSSMSATCKNHMEQIDVLKGLDFQAHEGEVIGVIGKNGAGKSTFLEILMTIKQYDAGNCQLCLMKILNHSRQINLNKYENKFPSSCNRHSFTKR